MKKNDNVTLKWKGVSYNLVFNLNVMEEIQEEYGSISEWGDLTDNEKEPNAKAVIFGLTAMLNEGIDIDNEDNAGVEGYVKKKALSLKSVGRLLTEVGLAEATSKLNKTVVESTKSDEKN